MQPWHRWREPLAVVLLVALALTLAAGIANVALSWRASDTGGPLGAPVDDLLLLSAAAAVLWCTMPVAESRAGEPAPSRHAWPLAVVGLVVIGATVLGQLALAVWNAVLILRTPVPSPGFVLFAVEDLLRLVVPAAAIVAVGLATYRARPANPTRPGQPHVSQPPASQPQPELTTSTAEPPDAPLPERLPAAWQADEAAGAVWLTADDAAQGRPGLSWSEPAEDWAQAEAAQASAPADEDDDLR